MQYEAIVSGAEWCFRVRHSRIWIWPVGAGPGMWRRATYNGPDGRDKDRGLMQGAETTAMLDAVTDWIRGACNGNPKIAGAEWDT